MCINPQPVVVTKKGYKITKFNRYKKNCVQLPRDVFRIVIPWKKSKRVTFFDERSWIECSWDE